MKVPISGSRSRSPSQSRSPRARPRSLAITDVPPRASQEAQGTRAVDLDGGAREEADGARAQESGHPPEVRGVAETSLVPELGDAIGGIEPRAQNVQRDPIVDQILRRGLRPRPQARPGGV